MASYTLFWANDTWEKYSKTDRILDYVAGNNKRPLSEIRPKDELFVVTLIRGNLYVAGRLIVATKPLNRREATSWLGRDDLIEKDLYFVASKGEADVFRSSCLVDLEIAKKMELIRVDKSIGYPALDKKNGFIERNAFRTSAQLSVKSADTLRSILAQSALPLRSIGVITAPVATIQPVPIGSQDIDGSHAHVSESPKGVDAEVGESGFELKRHLDEIIKDIDKECAYLEGADVDAIVKRRVGQGIFRSRLMDQFDGACCMTGLRNTRLLIASHIVPWSESESIQKLDPDNGLLLSVAMDALFDKGLISFSENGRMLIGKDLDSETIEILGLKGEFSLPEKLLTNARKGNLAEHRKLHAFDIFPV